MDKTTCAFKASPGSGMSHLLRCPGYDDVCVTAAGFSVLWFDAEVLRSSRKALSVLISPSLVACMQEVVFGAS